MQVHCQGFRLLKIEFKQTQPKLWISKIQKFYAFRRENGSVRFINIYCTLHMFMRLFAVLNDRPTFEILFSIRILRTKDHEFE